MGYMVRRGDSLHKIARKTGTSTERLIRLNPQISNPNRIYPGQMIRTN